MRRYRRSHRRAARWFVFAALVVALRLFFVREAPSTPETLTEGSHRVSRVVDGDTLLLESGARVRLQGIDTPETVRPDHPVEAWGPEASNFTTAFVDESGGVVRLTFGKERLDRYGRFLAFVWRGERMLNEELVRAGYAHARLEYRYSASMKRRLENAQDEAQAAKRGIWSDK